MLRGDAGHSPTMPTCRRRYDGVVRAVLRPRLRLLACFAWLAWACTGEVSGPSVTQQAQAGASGSTSVVVACQQGQQSCGNTCVDVQSSAQHCGACGQACATGVPCVAGQCGCVEPAATSCDNSCVDLRTDAKHCGSCATSCGNALCVAGACVCPTGQTLCGETCVDPMLDAQHCGGCGLACTAGVSCLGSICGGRFGDSCGDVPASGISIRELALYQAGKVPLMREGTAVARADRPADVIQGKPGRLRVFVDVAAGWLNRPVAAHLTLTNGDVTSRYASKLTVSQASSEDGFGSTINFDLKAEDIALGTRYAVELVECGGTPSGQLGAPRFPQQNDEALGVKVTGKVTLRFVPVVVNGRTASSDDARLALYVDYVTKLYPLAQVDYSVRDPYTTYQQLTANGDGWVDVLDEISALHEFDDAPNDVYYYGLLEPAVSGSDFCKQGCTAGIAYQLDHADAGNTDFRHERVAIGLSYGDDGSETSSSSAETLAHELGHNHGRAHAPCGDPNQLDNGYPYAGARLGWWGFESPDTLYTPNMATDIMGYCNDQWISDYTYRALAERIALINRPLRVLARPTAAAHYRFLLTDAQGARWGAERRAHRTPTGEPRAAEILDAAGSVIASVVAYRTPIDHLQAARWLVPDPHPGWFAVQVAGAPPLAF